MTYGRTNVFTLKTNPLRDTDLQDFVDVYNPKNRYERVETERSPRLYL